jgi:hypothetical protein
VGVRVQANGEIIPGKMARNGWVGSDHDGAPAQHRGESDDGQEPRVNGRPPHGISHGVREGQEVIASGSDNARSTAAGTDAREAIRRTDDLGQLRLVGDQDGETVLDGEANAATGTNQRLLVAGQCCLPLGVDRAAEKSENGVVHTERV